MREWEPRFVGLLRNVLSCRHKDFDHSCTQLPVDEVVTHESQSSETVIDDIMTDVEVLKMEDGRVEGLSHLGKYRNCELCTGAKGEPRDHENTTVH